MNVQHAQHPRTDAHFDTCEACNLYLDDCPEYGPSLTYPDGVPHPHLPNDPHLPVLNDPR